jgi:methionyl aminopeptidase
MVHLKTLEEIKIMQECGAILHKSVQELLPFIHEGITTNEIDKEAERLIVKNGGSSSFKRVEGYKWSTCLCINEQVVHTPPSTRKVKKGDVFTLDIGAFYKGFHTDYATTFVVDAEPAPEVKKFLEVGKNALYKAIKEAVIGNHLGHISKSIQDDIYGNGYFIMKELTGHGVGHILHEDPFIPGYLDRAIEKTYKIRPGLVIAIEVIYSMGSEDIRQEPDNDWSIITKDKSLSACFEETVAITDENTVILT